MRRYLNYEMNTYMQDILMRTDKISMASSLEVRVPYLMPELLEYIQTMPETYLVDYKKPLMHGTKIVLKELCAEEFGADFAYRNKFGLGMPMLHFFKDHGVRQYVEEKIFPTIEKRGIIDYNYMRKVWNEVMGSTEFGDERVRILWLIFSFEIWAKIYIDDSPVNQKQNIINEHVENHRIH